MTVGATDGVGDTGRGDLGADRAGAAKATLKAKGGQVIEGVARFTHDPRRAPGPLQRDAVEGHLPVAARQAADRRRHGQRYAIRPDDVGVRLRVQLTVLCAGLPAAHGQGHEPTPKVRHRVDVRRTVRYHVETRGKITTSLKEFKAQAQQTYEDARGWRAAGIRFVPVARGGAFTLVLSQASLVPSFSSQCSSMWSCRVGRFVIINQDRWKNASPAWNAAHLALRDYRHMVVNHETGHWLGLRPRDLPRQGPAGAGDEAAVEGPAGLPVQPVPDDPRAEQPDTPWAGHGVPHVPQLQSGRRVVAPPLPRGEQLREIVVFSGSAHRPFASAVCESLGVELSSVELTRFSNDCLQAQLQANCRQRDVFIIQPLVPPTQEHLMELLLMLDAARGASAQQITAVIPYYAYARSDKKDASRLSIGGRLVADMLVAAGANRVITMTLHAPQVHAFFSVPVDHLTALGVLADHFQGQDLTNSVVVSPDFGNAKTATQFSRLLGLPVAAGSKKRLADDQVVIDEIVGDVEGKRAIILDDEIATGGSIVELLERLSERGCTSAAVACTHGLFVGKAIERLRDHPMITEVVTTDTVPAPEGWPELQVRSVAGLFGAAIQRIHAGESVSSLFDGVDPAHGPPQPRLFD